MRLNRKNYKSITNLVILKFKIYVFKEVVKYVTHKIVNKMIFWQHLVSVRVVVELFTIIALKLG